MELIAYFPQLDILFQKKSINLLIKSNYIDSN